MVIPPIFAGKTNDGMVDKHITLAAAPQNPGILLDSDLCTYW